MFTKEQLEAIAKNYHKKLVVLKNTMINSLCM